MAYSLIPTEILVKILGYLNVSDRLSACLACKHWHSASLSSYVTQRTAFVLHDDCVDAMHKLKRGRHVLRHLVLKEVDVQPDMEFWEIAGKTLKCISFHSCDILERLFVDIIKSCPLLEVLHIIGCNGLFISGTLLEKCLEVELFNRPLQYLKELSLASNRYLSDALFNKLVQTMPNIEKMSVGGCQITFHPGIFKRFYPGGLIVEPSRAVLTFQNIMVYLASKRSQIVSLDFSRTLIDATALKSIVSLQLPKLEELHLVACEQLMPSGITYLCDHQSMLKVLDLSLCYQLTDQTLIYICSHLHELRTLKLQRCHNLTNRSVQTIGQLTKLETLDLSSCEKTTSEGFTPALCVPFRIHMSELVLSNCYVTNDVILNLVSFTQNLTVLDLSYCLLIPDASVNAIVDNLVTLRTLRLAWCKNITDKSLAGEQGPRINPNKFSSPNVFHIPLFSSRSSSLHLRDPPLGPHIQTKATNEQMEIDSSVENYPGNFYPLSRLSSLRVLDLCGCVNISDWGIEKGIRFTELNYLNLSLCHNLTNYGLKCIGHWNPSLETLILSQCHQITDEGLASALNNLPRMKYLDVQGCKSLTNETLHIIKKCCLDLRYLNITLCSNITIDYIEEEMELPRLRTIHK